MQILLTLAGGEKETSEDVQKLIFAADRWLPGNQWQENADLWMGKDSVNTSMVERIERT